jgi:PEP-CTERM motif-containing protein
VSKQQVSTQNAPFGKRAIFAIAVAAAILLSNAAASAKADTVSLTGTLANAEDTYTTTINVATDSTVTLQTYGFGGGVNALGTSIAAGGFDPFVAIFSGTGSGATIETDALGDTFGTSDALSNYSSFMGCPPAGTVNLGGAICGDITMTLALDPGIYTILLSDALYVANAVNDNGTLGEGFTDFTGGAFQTCNTTDSGTTCANDTANWALDITTTPTTGGGGGTSVPEPSTLPLVLLALLVVAFFLARQDKSPRRHRAHA